MTVVSNSGPIIHLSMGGQIELLPQLFGEILVPRMVYEEVVIDGRGLPGSEELRRATWVRIVDEVDASEIARFLAEQLDPGEAHALALSVQTKAERLLLDDREARHIANNRNIPIIGTMGILLKALRQGAIARIAPVLGEMKRKGFWLSPKLEHDVLVQAGERRTK